MGEKILFVNARVRSQEQSRTHQLSMDFLREYYQKSQDVVIREICLAEECLQPLTNKLLDKRNAMSKEGNFRDGIFQYAKDFADADVIVIGAPYWDLSFPSILKVYFEYVSVCGLTFYYSETGEAIGLCKAGKLIYITTAGGYVGENLGYQYVKSLCNHLFGIMDTECIAAEGLDIQGNSVRDRMDLARKSFDQIIYKVLKINLNQGKIDHCFIPVETVEHAQKIAKMANEIWNEYYSSFLPREQVDDLLDNQSEELIEEQIRDGHEYYFLKVGGSVVGYIAIHAENHMLSLDQIYLFKEYRHRGYANLCFRFFEEICKERGLTRMALTVNKKNWDAIQVYQQKGMRIVKDMNSDGDQDSVQENYTFTKEINGEE